MLQPGDAFPAFNSVDFEGEPLTLDDLLGSPFVIYFYPKDDTPICTTQACSFRDAYDAFDDVDILVVGVSPDSPESHRKFMEKHDLNFPLISDQNLDFSKKCGVEKEGKIVRTTFLCDEEGVVQWVESPVNVDGHVERVMDAIEDAFA